MMPRFTNTNTITSYDTNTRVSRRSSDTIFGTLSIVFAHKSNSKHTGSTERPTRGDAETGMATAAEELATMASRPLPSGGEDGRGAAATHCLLCVCAVCHMRLRGGCGWCARSCAVNNPDNTCMCASADAVNDLPVDCQRDPLTSHSTLNSRITY